MCKKINPGTVRLAYKKKDKMHPCKNKEDKETLGKKIKNLINDIFDFRTPPRIPKKHESDEAENIEEFDDLIERGD
ncbi:MAG: hypothetical protein PHH61_05595 [Candidatus Nanoarchaeia archaeon]|nr:hypothetical protein [Candidatus Nanoarchaeia archaeon]